VNKTGTAWKIEPNRDEGAIKVWFFISKPCYFAVEKLGLERLRPARILFSGVWYPGNQKAGYPKLSFVDTGSLDYSNHCISTRSQIIMMAGDVCKRLHSDVRPPEFITRGR